MGTTCSKIKDNAKTNLKILLCKGNLLISSLTVSQLVQFIIVTVYKLHMSNGSMDKGDKAYGVNCSKFHFAFIDGPKMEK